MKKTYLGTILDEEDYLKFGILAATKGTSKSGLLKILTLDFLTKNRLNPAKVHAIKLSIKKGRAVK